VYAEEDQVADPKLNKSFAEQIAANDKTVVERKGNYHEVLNETDRKELFTDIKRWIETRA
jgi:alpha-beta hydrolase superfamily lysophospholipase